MQDAETLSLLVVQGNKPGSSFAIPASGLTIGRGQNADIAIQDDAASGKHCQISRNSNGWVLTDLDSTNGTQLNGTPVQEALLSGGDTIQCGDTLLKVVSTAPVAPDRQAVPNDSGEDWTEDTRKRFRRIEREYKVITGVLLFGIFFGLIVINYRGQLFSRYNQFHNSFRQASLSGGFFVSSEQQESFQKLLPFRNRLGLIRIYYLLSAILSFFSWILAIPMWVWFKRRKHRGPNFLITLLAIGFIIHCFGAVLTLGIPTTKLIPSFAGIRIAPLVSLLPLLEISRFFFGKTAQLFHHYTASDPKYFSEI